ncbi:unnamed protein product [Polarella glacialis]|uniref:RBR-type E3 ubiquitin transferase n=1 Tax=Polarella glacialis TaxID=89957 RepID=A0A813FV99_POLGL|nr:unnamed protein product [Polarella glacialis]
MESWAEEQAEELEALRAIFGDDCEVQCQEHGAVSFTLQVTADLECVAGDGGDVLVRAEVTTDPPGEAEEDTPGQAGLLSSSSSQEQQQRQQQQRQQQPQLTALELAEQAIQGRGAPSKCAPLLERSKSGKHMSCPEARVKFLPPFTLQLSLPKNYPVDSAPEFHLASCWLSEELLAGLCKALDEFWEHEGKGAPVIFQWAELIRREAALLLDREGSVAVLTLRALIDEARVACHDARAVAEYNEPGETLMELLLYDQQRHLEVWRQQQQLCQICFCDQPGSQFVHLGRCPHAFCKGCITSMAELHVREGSVAELLCPEPSCRAEISPGALAEVLDEANYERWHRLKLQKVLASEMDDVVFCPRCDEFGRETPVLSQKGAAEGEPPLAQCTKCQYVFCGSCLGTYHGASEPCMHPAERQAQVAMRRLESPERKSAFEKRKLKRQAEKGFAFEVQVGEATLLVDAAGFVSEAREPDVSEGDQVIRVLAGTGENNSSKPLWAAGATLELLHKALESPPPLTIQLRMSRTGAEDRMRQRRLMEELLTLRTMARDTKKCPTCHVRVQRSAGCNHMQCTQCRTHFCYRCGKQMPADSPYSHFQAGGCTTFDTEEVQRMVVEERRGGNQGMDQELVRLRQEFGDQGELFAQFVGNNRHMPAGGRAAVARRRQAGDAQCPTCRQWNARLGLLNHVRCATCRSSYCANCRRRIQGVITDHFRGHCSCPQHERDGGN